MDNGEDSIEQDSIEKTCCYLISSETILLLWKFINNDNNNEISEVMLKEV